MFDDGIRVFVDGQKLVEKRETGTEATRVCLLDGKHDFRVEYWQLAGYARLYGLRFVASEILMLPKARLRNQSNEPFKDKAPGWQFPSATKSWAAESFAGGQTLFMQEMLDAVSCLNAATRSSAASLDGKGELIRWPSRTVPTAGS